MNLGGSFSMIVSRSGVKVMFLVFIQAAFCRVVARVVNIRDGMVVDVDQAFVFVDFFAS